jgi:hypothetical protein
MTDATMSSDYLQVVLVSEEPIEKLDMTL